MPLHPSRSRPHPHLGPPRIAPSEPHACVKLRPVAPPVLRDPVHRRTSVVVPRNRAAVEADEMRAAPAELRPSGPERRADRDLGGGDDVRRTPEIECCDLEPLLVLLARETH